MEGRPYGIISDTHNHNWDSFSTVGSDGVNTRLRVILNEFVRCAEEVTAAGGDTIYHAGDLFHVRGSVAPSVLNPTLEVYRRVVDSGMRIIINAGNHDLEGKDASRIGSAITALEEVGCIVINDERAGLKASENVILIPWNRDVAALKGQIQSAADIFGGKVDNIDLILHAPIDDVIVGLPPHGLVANDLAAFGFRFVFAGHYHHHKDFGNGVYSVGACAHHTWSDVGSKAGFLIVSDKVKWRSSRAPQFIDLSSEMDPSDIPLIVDGNYVRARIASSKQKDIADLREYLTECGAIASVVLSQKETSVAPRVGATIAAGASIEASVSDFIKSGTYTDPDKLTLLCRGILSRAQAMEEGS